MSAAETDPTGPCSDQRHRCSGDPGHIARIRSALSDSLAGEGKLKQRNSQFDGPLMFARFVRQPKTFRMTCDLRSSEWAPSGLIFRINRTEISWH